VSITQLGKTVLPVAQNAYAALKIAHYAYVLEVGAIVLEGAGKDLIKDPRICDVYLGG
jgi:branched-chain amino acid transport system ATP-binding protein